MRQEAPPQPKNYPAILEARTGLKRPIDFDIAQGEVLWVRATPEWNGGVFPNGAVRAIAARKILSADPLVAAIGMPQHTVDVRTVLGERRELNAPLDDDAVRLEMLVKNGFRFRLRNEQNVWKACVGASDVAEIDRRRVTAIDV